MTTEAEVRTLALSLLGSPYVLGNEPWYNEGGEPSSHPTATDCSGLVFGVFRKARIPWRTGGPWPRLTANGYAKACDRIPRSAVRCGDVALFAGKSGHVYHIALCISHDETVEARGRRWGVVKYRIDDPANGVARRGAYFGRFPWVILEEDDMTRDQDKLLKLIRVSLVAHSNDTKALLAQLRGDPARADALLAQAQAEAEAEKRRLGLT